MVIAVCTRVSTPSFSSTSWRARQLITVPSMPMESALARSMPRSESTRPRNMLPPPTTAATSTPSATAAAISLAMWNTTSGEMPRASSPEHASPDSFTTTSRQRWWAFLPAGSEPQTRAMCPPSPAVTAQPRYGSSGLAHLEPGEPAHGDPVLAEQLLDCLLRILDERLIGQHDILEERVQPAFDDLRDGLLGLALVAGYLLGDGAFLLDYLAGHLVPGDVLRAHGRDLLREVFPRLRRRLIELYEHADRRRQVAVGPVQVARHVAALELGVPADFQLLLE